MSIGHIATASLVLLVSVLLPAPGQADIESGARLPEHRDRLVVTDDSLDMILPKTYFHFTQYYDSCAVTCMFGEIRIGRASGVSDLVFPYCFFTDEHSNPHAFMSYANMADSSRTEYITLEAGDTLSYYKGLKLTTQFTSTAYFGLDDTIFFITQLVDSASGSTIATLDTAAIILRDSLHNCAFYHNVAMRGTPRNIWKFVRPPDWEYEKVALTIRIIFNKRESTIDNLCRWDVWSNALYSASDAYYTELLVALYDSIAASGQGKLPGGFVSPSTIRLPGGRR